MLLLYKYKVTTPHNKDRRDYLKDVQIISSICNELKIVQYNNLFEFVKKCEVAKTDKKYCIKLKSSSYI